MTEEKQQLSLIKILNEGSPEDIKKYFKRENKFDNKTQDQILES
jgi:hypothetical protein